MLALLYFYPICAHNILLTLGYGGMCSSCKFTILIIMVMFLFVWLSGGKTDIWDQNCTAFSSGHTQAWDIMGMSKVKGQRVAIPPSLAELIDSQFETFNNRNIVVKSLIIFHNVPLQ